MSFIVARNKGFAMTFENGFTISFQWGTENYCEKKNTTIHPTDPMKHDRWDSLSAEVAVFENEKMISIGDDDDIIGWCSPDEVAKYIEIVSKAEPASSEIPSKFKELRKRIEVLEKLKSEPEFIPDTLSQSHDGSPGDRKFRL